MSEWEKEAARCRELLQKLVDRACGKRDLYPIKRMEDFLILAMIHQHLEGSMVEQKGELKTFSLSEIKGVNHSLELLYRYPEDCHHLQAQRLIAEGKGEQFQQTFSLLSAEK